MNSEGKTGSDRGGGKLFIESPPTGTTNLGN
jgi:hypothetical protein